MARNTRTKTFGVASVVVCGVVTVTVVVRSVVGALAKAAPAGGTTPTGGKAPAAPAGGTTTTARFCQPGDRDCKR
ncbi:hypothetical protein WN990_14605 [Kitasatospora purpeofusca]|uniref:hypothetical protein n=1 Tax=Kitasatospora purpeofusca TaxID=67352 RepID=UPI0030F10CD3